MTQRFKDFIANININEEINAGAARKLHIKIGRTGTESEMSIPALSQRSQTILDNDMLSASTGQVADAAAIFTDHHLTACRAGRRTIATDQSDQNEPMAFTTKANRTRKQILEIHHLASSSVIQESCTCPRYCWHTAVGLYGHNTIYLLPSRLSLKLTE
jgi:hypothetical protein